MTRNCIQFRSKGRTIRLDRFVPQATVLDWLRLDERATGTKEGCAEGDCGACTVVIAREHDGRLVYEPVNACIATLGQLDGGELITVEDLAQEGNLHPVQTAMAAGHGSQCGFCTPGIVMSLFAHFHGDGERTDRAGINDCLAGNLCRCTGYRSIVDAAREACAGPVADSFVANEPGTIAALRQLDDHADVFVGNEASFFAAPASEAALASLYQRHPDARIIGGATDVGLWITKKLAVLDKIIHLGRAGLDAIEQTADAWHIGASVTLARATPPLASIDPDIAEILRRFGSVQVRAAGTVGGSIANASPIGDLAPLLIALGGHIELRKGDAVRALPLEQFFIGYGKQDREPGEFIRRLIVPKLSAGTLFRAFKVSKRFDEDITTVLGAFRIGVDGGRIASARIAFGGMAATPKRATAVENQLVGAALHDAGTWRLAAERISDDFTPLTDMRASAEYRLNVARNIVIKALAEIAGVSSPVTRILDSREAVDVAD
ncbi:MAG: xanthine dehydrogenase small subunit [Bradyrhizobium sp.]|uniref:xanthine dehydrogenase small subunit n=1 Tax=Bradyrhizobium sp. TaxID=376 RepID=UPI00121D7B06|nr:xanthine dehydrogenase small subunit [Bradyrhizobium sp.]THD49235.1 MAG: xanthine dehydrogenase small subunit [Bradyrhizobium sp.]